MRGDAPQILRHQRNLGAIIILTGGRSSRMGRPKALLPLAASESQTFLERILELTEGLARERLVVSSLELDLEPGVTQHLQPYPEEGQLSSLLIGWRALETKPDWVMVCLVDHPYVKRDTLESLILATYRSEAAMWSPSFQHRSGHPVLFSASTMALLEQSPLHLGARPVVRQLGQGRSWVEVDDPAVLWDTDTPEEYQRYSEAWTLSCLPNHL